MATEGGGDPQSVTQATAPVLEVDSAIRSPEDPKRVILQPAALSVENERPTHIPALPAAADPPDEEARPDEDPFDPSHTPAISFRKRPLSMNSSSKPPPVMQRAISHPASVGGHSHRSHGSTTASDHLIPPPSTPDEKRKMTRRYMAVVTAISYTLFLIVFALIVFITDAVENNARYPLAEVFGLFMVSVGIVYFVFLYIDIRLHVRRTHAAIEELERRRQAYDDMMARTAAQFNNGPLALNPNAAQNPHDWNLPRLAPVPHNYCFVSGRHGEFIYLKLGATWFCFGLLIHSVLLLSYQGILMNRADAKWAACASNSTIALEVLFLCYCLFLVFFFWKYANVVINHYRGLARFGLMHAIGTALAFWVYTIVRETHVAILIKMAEDKAKKEDGIDVQGFGMPLCPGPEDLNAILNTFSPYLYPFVIEFNILIVGLLYMIYANINSCPKKLSAKGHSGGGHGHGSTKSIAGDGDSVCSEHQDNSEDHEVEVKGKMVVYGDCHAASRGLFAGMILIVATIVVIILFHIASRDDDYRDTGILLDSIFEVTVLGIMILATILAYFQTSKLDINQHPISRLDDVLLFIAIPAFFSETVFTLVPAFANVSILNGFIAFAQIIQVLIQTPWIIDALRRCSNAPELRRNKPGKELVTFMTIANVSLWIYYTFSVKTGDFGDERYTFYGYVLWSILNHLSLPLIMFYRFHASVCLVDIWRHSYEPGEFAHH
ncbi:proton channel OtopLc-like [Culex quinquefasciatus]|uniref:proton channel OtopLc-like n=1 Tax=Culex quinquefasciatus TaxID=7176 RepID=UPI0018E301D9|nr:proton channel OtopLc-like [Culex quinquefasciatus]